MAALLRRAAGRAAALALDHSAGAATTANRLLSWRLVIAVFLALIALAWSLATRPFPAPGDVPILDLIEFEDPGFYAVIRTWHLLMPSVMAFNGVMVLTSAYRLWFGPRTQDRRFGRGTLPRWPTSPENDSPALVVGEVHHPTEPHEIRRPAWLTLPERGLYTGVAIFGAVGTGKTSACMRPFAQQLLSWQSADPQKRAAALVLEVKGDFCHDIRAVLEDAGRGDDYTELALGGRWQWNPLASAMDSYSLAYTVASLLNQLFGKSKEPFWQQAYTNLIRWLIELHRALPDQWVTFQDLYHCAIEPERIDEKIKQAKALSGPPPGASILIPARDLATHMDPLTNHEWQPAGGERLRTAYDKELLDTLASLGVPATVEEHSRPPSEHAQRVAAIERWYRHDWLQLDPKLRTSIVEGVSVFLSMFDLPDVARVFCPPAPQPTASIPADLPPPPPGAAPAAAAAGLLQRLPPLQQLIESGRVIALNMPAGANPALARTVGVLLKNAWLQTLLTRPAAIKTNPNRYFRPAVFLCDEYQSFASVGEDDPSGDEKAFALTRQCRVIPIVATQSISSLKSVLPGQDAWRTLLQTLRTKVFLSLSDDSSAELASNMCGKVLRLSPSYSFTESAKPGFSVITARAGGAKGTLGTSKSYREQREPLFHPRSFSLLENCQAIVLPYDGTNAKPATRVYLKPHYLPRDRPYW
ncbi:MAG: type IV secretory system conjugative DNA transfer family protein, partial [Acidobacteria bacterium]|nr:type IV secretory system conjugative DNA transfer family protein [Acidobacteriota bacterium]